jgi:hypothetical protein
VCLLHEGNIQFEATLRKVTDIVNKLWGFCHTLRHDGIDYGDYIEQLVTDCLQLKIPAADGKKYLTDVADSETLLRLQFLTHL